MSVWLLRLGRAVCKESGIAHHVSDIAAPGDGASRRPGRPVPLDLRDRGGYAELDDGQCGLAVIPRDVVDE